MPATLLIVLPAAPAGDDHRVRLQQSAGFESALRLPVDAEAPPTVRTFTFRQQVARVDGQRTLPVVNTAADV